MINVTKTYLPPMEEYLEYLNGIWARNQLTNHGPLAAQLELKLKEVLGVKHLFFVGNGTVALQLAIKALELQGDVITTPFSYVATTSSIVWEGCNPVFVDIDRSTLCMNPNLIEQAITPSTKAILATHVFGYPCAVERIQEIANKHALKVIYDGAHAFGVTYRGQSLASYGDVTAFSFHATKLFHTAEGGAVATNDDTLARKISYMRNFGHNGPEAFAGLGINGKNSEFHAAMGLCVLPKVPGLIANCRIRSEIYDDELHDVKLRKPTYPTETEHNFSYYPVIFSSEAKLFDVRNALNEIAVFPRRYFFPSLNELPYVIHKSTPVSKSIARRILCLPIYYDLSKADIQSICQVVRRVCLQRH